MSGEDMCKGTTGKENPIGKVESRTADLKATAADILELSTTIEGFLLGTHPATVSEKTEKKAPNGWLELHFEDLRDVTITLQHALECLRSVKSVTK